MFEVRTTRAKPTLAAILLVSSPVTFHSQALSTFPTHERLHTMLPLVMRLQGSEILQRLCPWVVYVVFAPLCATVAWDA